MEYTSGSNTNLKTVSSRQLEVAFCLVGVSIALAAVVAERVLGLNVLDPFGVIEGVTFGMLNIVLWRMILRRWFQLHSDDGRKALLQLELWLLIAFKISVLLLGIYSLGFVSPTAVRGFLVGFVSFLMLGSLLVLVLQQVRERKEKALESRVKH